MSRARGGDARMAALIAIGALLIHQLRYQFAHGAGTGAALQAQGHAYLEVVSGPLIALAAASLGASLMAPLLIPHGRSRRCMGLLGLMLTFAAVLLGIFTAQELVEGVLFAGHAGGLAAPFADGGWLAVPIALALAPFLALLAGLLESVERAIEARLGPRRATARAGHARLPGPPAFARSLLALDLGFGFARRPPPARPA